MMTWTILRSKGGRRDWRENSGSENRWVVELVRLCLRALRVLHVDDSEEPLVEIHLQY